MSATYTIEATPERGRWSLVVDGVGVSSVRRLDQAVDEMRAAVVDLTGANPDEVEMILDVRMDQSLREELSQLQHDQAEAERLNKQAAFERRQLARRLREQDLPLRDIATIMGISYQRVAQLI